MVGHHPAIKTGIKRFCVYTLVVLYPHGLSEGDITNDNNSLKSLKQFLISQVKLPVNRAGSCVGRITLPCLSALSDRLERQQSTFYADRQATFLYSCKAQVYQSLFYLTETNKNLFLSSSQDFKSVQLSYQIYLEISSTKLNIHTHISTSYHQRLLQCFANKSKPSCFFLSQSSISL